MSVYPRGAEVQRGAVLSADGRYRYRLTRRWYPGTPHLPFIMLNPSTADAELDDPTIRRCVGFARRLDYGGIAVFNLYAYRATDPEQMWGAIADIVGHDNDRRLRNLLRWASAAEVPVVAGWGAQERHQDSLWRRVGQVLAMPGSESLHCLGTTRSGAPRHPSRIGYETDLVPYDGHNLAVPS